MNMQNLMAQAQRMQRDIMKKKEEVEKMTFNGKSEMVEVTMNGKKEVISIKFINKDVLEQDDLEILQDMTVIAVNNAIAEANKAMDNAMGQYGTAFNGLF